MSSDPAVGLAGSRSPGPYAGQVQPLPNPPSSDGAGLVVGFDLDLTLIDSRFGIGATYRALAAATGVPIDSDAIIRRIGPPVEVQLAAYFPAEEIPAVADRFRQMYAEFGITNAPALPGVTDSFAAVRRHSGRIVVITGKNEANVWRHLRHLELAVDTVVGMVWGPDKVAAMREHGADIYVGDHPADMAAARQAHPTVAVGVLTGDHSAAELREAGADVVLSDLSEFPAWLDDHRAAARISVGFDGGDR
jgi:phosphoglycolate phosphatase-like HAD superfamily hydrolase